MLRVLNTIKLKNKKTERRLGLGEKGLEQTTQNIQLYTQNTNKNN